MSASVPIVYVEIPAPNMDMAIKFYRDLFLWKIEESLLNEKRYAMFTAGENNDVVLGGLISSLKPSAEGIILYIRVADINQKLTQIEKAGGATLRAKFEIGGGYGFSAEFKDPNGNRLGLWSRE